MNSLAQLIFRCGQEFVPLVILGPVKLLININHHKQYSTSLENIAKRPRQLQNWDHVVCRLAFVSLPFQSICLRTLVLHSSLWESATLTYTSGLLT